MKKTFAFVLAIILLCPVALADTLREQVNAPMEHKGTYSSPSGRSHIYVDAQVIVPEAETIPIYQAFARVPDEMEFKLLADLAFGEGGYTLERGKTDANNPAGVTYAEGDPAGTAKGFHTYCISTDLRSASLLHQQEDFSYVQAYYGIWDYAKNTYAYPSLVYFALGGNFGKNLPPEADARAAADAVVSQVLPDFQFWGSADKKNLNHLGERISQGGLMEYGYRFYYTRVLNGIPVSYVYVQGGSDTYSDAQTTMYAPVPPYEKLFIDVGENGIFQIQLQHPLQIGDVIGEAALLPFDQIMEVFGRIAPLSIAANELNSKFGKKYVNNLYIKEIRLGYMCTMDRDRPERHLLIPVWDFYGEREFRDGYYAFDNQSLFTINAMDGTVIDRDYGY